MSGLPSWARVGAKVVCVKDLWQGRRMVGIARPCVGAIYTIDHVSAQSLNEWHGPAISLVEIDSDPYGFELSAFRPLHTIESDLEAHFSALLTVSTPQPEEVQ